MGKIQKFEDLEWEEKVEMLADLCTDKQQLVVLNSLLVIANEIGGGHYFGNVAEMIDTMLETEYIPTYCEFYDGKD